MTHLIDTVATCFARQLLDELGYDTVSRIDEENRQRRESGDWDTCASHDYCDANMTMADAFDALGLDAAPDTVDIELWDEAWTLAKVQGFIETAS